MKPLLHLVSRLKKCVWCFSSVTQYICRAQEFSKLPDNFIYLLTYLLTPWCRVLLEQLTGLQLVKRFPAFYGTQRFVTALTNVRHPSLSRANPVQSIYPHTTSSRSILILSAHLRLGLPSGLLPSGFPTKTLYTHPLLTHTRQMPSPSHSSRFYHPHSLNGITINLITTQSD